MKTEIIDVTPALARKFLGKNAEYNRKVRDTRVETYASDMRNGRWAQTGDSIKFNENGELVDGQHRLHAVILAEVTVPMLVVRGLSLKSALVMDIGATRGFGDALAFESGEKNPRVGAIVKWVYNYERGLPTNKERFPTTQAERLDRFYKDPELFIEASKRSHDITSTRILGNGTAAGVAYFLFHNIDAEYTKQFFDHLMSGANLHEKHPILILRNRLARARVDRLNLAEQLCLYVRAWNNFLTDTPVVTLYVNGSDKMRLSNNNFPKILTVKRA